MVSGAEGAAGGAKPLGGAVVVQLDAEAIQAQVTAAILDSAIGKSLKTTLEKLAADWKVGQYWDDSLKKMVESEVQSLIRKLVLEAAEPYIRDAVVKLVTPDAVRAIVDKGFERARIKVESY